MDLRNKLHRTFRQQRSPQSWELYRQHRNLVVNMLRKSKRHYFSVLVGSRRDPTTVWTALKQAITNPGSRSCWSDFQSDKCTLANNFNRHFTQIASVEGSNTKPTQVVLAEGTKTKTAQESLVDNLTSRPGIPFTLSPVTVDDISEIMSDLNPNKSTGPDTIPPGILKCSKPVTSTPLCHIVNSSLRTGSFPNQWKHATVIPLHKGGNKLELRNYRPISLLPVPSKLLERVVSNQLTSHLESNQLLYRHQSGFRRLHSTTTTLLHATDVWSRALDNGMCVGVLFLDVAKAFDSVNHSTLLGKLPNFGLDQSAIAWFRSYLSGRTQSTAIGDSTSDISNTSLGVPQGSILGPTLFSMYVNDLPSAITCAADTILYADDTTIYAYSKSVSELTKLLTSAIKEVDKWMTSNQLRLNIAKSKCMLLHSSRRKNLPPLQLNYNSQDIEQVQRFKFLGLWINENLTWDDHVSSIVLKASKKINLLRHLSWFLPKCVLIQFYSSYILPCFDYADVIWNGCTVECCTKLERLQNYAARIILHRKRSDSATAMKSELGWESLSNRRKLHILTMTHKAVNGLLPSYLGDLFTRTNSVHSHHTRGSHTRLYVPAGKTNYVHKFTVATAITLWNTLPDSIRSLKSSSNFKVAAKNYLSTHTV